MGWSSKVQTRYTAIIDEWIKVDAIGLASARSYSKTVKHAAWTPGTCRSPLDTYRLKRDKSPRRAHSEVPNSIPQPHASLPAGRRSNSLPWWLRWHTTITRPSRACYEKKQRASHQDFNGRGLALVRRRRMPKDRRMTQFDNLHFLLIRANQFTEFDRGYMA